MVVAVNPAVSTGMLLSNIVPNIYPLPTFVGRHPCELISGPESDKFKAVFEMSFGAKNHPARLPKRIEIGRGTMGDAEDGKEVRVDRVTYAGGRLGDRLLFVYLFTDKGDGAIQLLDRRPDAALLISTMYQALDFGPMSGISTLDKGAEEYLKLLPEEIYGVRPQTAPFKLADIGDHFDIFLGFRSRPLSRLFFPRWDVLGHRVYLGGDKKYAPEGMEGTYSHGFAKEPPGSDVIDIPNVWG